MKLVTACIETTNKKDSFGYGHVFRIRFGRRINLAHVCAWIDEHGCLPPEDKPCVLHRCDNPSCINPEHLFVGTITDNNRDKAVKGRHHNQLKTYCPANHEYNEENTIHIRGERRCRICHNETARRSRAKKALAS